ncbi:MAG TPA: DUF397 domain-containing protein [Spirillospora sp.]|nr:DUF397 domain-containing protein [Spirillospora sp.]
MTQWRKSGRSNTSGGQCVEVARLVVNIGLRDSKDPEGAKIALPGAVFRVLLDAVKRGDYDLP